MSWLTPAIREIMGDSAMTNHKLAFMEGGGTPSMVVSLDPNVSLDKFNSWVEAFDQRHGDQARLVDRYKTMYLGGGADVEVVGATPRQLDFKSMQGGGETRIASAAGVPPILAGLSEGLASATYSNYGMARRAFTDMTMWDLWDNVSGSLESIMPVPPNARLAIDGRNIPFLQEDSKDRAEIQTLDASAINSLVAQGFVPRRGRGCGRGR